MRKQIWLLVFLALLTGVLVGCAGTPVDDTTPTPENSPVSTLESTPEATVESDAEEAAWPRTYVDATGREVVLEEKPERIAVSFVVYWEYLIALEQPPVAAGDAENYRETWLPFGDNGTSEVIDIGVSNALNLEMLTEIAPDLILVGSVNSEEERENLEKIAPVIVLADEIKMDWRFGLREIAGIIGEEEKAESKITEMEERLAEAKANLAEAYQDKTVMLISVMRKDSYYCAYRSDFFDAETGLGLTAPEGYPTENVYQQISLEALVEMNPDYIFMGVFDTANIEELEDNSVWNALEAVKNDHVYVLGGYAHSAGILSTELTINKVVEALLE